MQNAKKDIIYICINGQNNLSLIETVMVIVTITISFRLKLFCSFIHMYIISREVNSLDAYNLYLTLVLTDSLTLPLVCNRNHFAFCVSKSPLDLITFVLITISLPMT